MENRLIMETPIGNILLREQDGSLREIGILTTLDAAIDSAPEPGSLLSKLAGQLLRYFSGEQINFAVSLEFPGTAFQQRVWHALQKIPAGQTRTYGELANRLGSSARAVGNACRRNPFPIVVPCHRVVSASGIGGFAGQISGTHIEIKHWLLQHEGVISLGTLPAGLSA